MTSSPSIRMPVDDLDGTKDYVLIVDDDHTFRQVLAHAVKSDGFHCIAASTAQEALDMILRLPPKLIVLNLIMRGIGGSELLKTLKNDPATASVQMIAISASALSSSVRSEALSLDARI